MSEFVQVAVRVRPLLDDEVDEGCESILNTLETPGEIYFKDHSQHFGSYKHVFSERAKQSDIYNRCIQPLVEKAFEGYNITIVSYGQQGSGKSHTMGTSHHTWDTVDNMGVIPRVIKDIFGKYKNTYDFTITFSLIEIYQDVIYDLLAKKPRNECILDIQEGFFQDVEIVDLSNITVNSPNEIFDAIQHNKDLKLNKLVLETKGHVVFTLNIMQNYKKSKLQFIDLVGKSHEKQAMKTYKGVLVLEKIISALTEEDIDQNSIPYQDSNLTKLFKDAFGGNSLTLMMACLSPADYDKNDTLSTLSCASLAGKIKNSPTINYSDNISVRADVANYSLSTETRFSDTAIDQLNKQVNELTLKNRNLVSQLSMAQQSITTKNIEISCLKTETTLLQKQIDQGEKKLKDFEVQLSNMSKNFSERYENEIDDLKKSKEVLSDQVWKNENQVRELQTQLELAKNTNQNQQKEIEQLRGLKDAMTRSMQNAAEKISRLETQSQLKQLTYPSFSSSLNSCVPYTVQEPDDFSDMFSSRSIRTVARTMAPSRSSGTGCGCQRTQCSTRQCGCRKAGVSCGSSCRCVGCVN